MLTARRRRPGGISRTVVTESTCTTPAVSRVDPVTESVPNFPALRASTALGYWFSAFVLGNLASLVAVVLVWRGQVTDTVPIWVTGISAGVMWLVFAAFLRLVSHGTGSGSMRHDFGFALRRNDLWVGVPLGVFSQLVLVNLVNWPLSRVFPGQFSPDKVEERARSIADSAPGAWVVLLVVVVVVAAPLIEELMYRGLIQQGLANSFGPVRGWVLGAVVFAAIHFAPVEFPGLFVFALVLGWCYRRTGRLGMGIITHMAFNATGLLVVMRVN